MLKVTLDVRRTGDMEKRVADISKACEGPKSVKVGLPAGKSDADLVQIAIWNHEGTAGSGKGFSVKRGGRTIGGFGGPIPRRPFLEVMVHNNKSKIRNDLRKIAEQVVAGKVDLRTALNRLGQVGAGLTQSTIQGGGFAPNAPLTVEIKGSSKPLIDQARLVGSITHQVTD
ncbi:hypothetical protein FHT98_0632 [Bosea sp. AK1]|uniref:hypothetical protein n=1 Tax=Bosea sp. AK1 TaxID=2587160 RepID=UPI001151203A|nr:hypothetical protein [Bosea sp. AK1]TQI72912.1 hypothetical protein FHT98_0632 [Bosea sp. AK1]